jgi:multicomponent Na+:H+ antiporter subunit G
MTTAYVGDALVILGLLMMTVAVYGMIRMRELYNRIHAASKAVFLGVLPIIVAAAMHAQSWEVVGRAVLVSAFLLLTSPISAHAMVRAAYRAGDRLETDLD